ncbi:MAG: hypothetical protein D6743_13025 [Calditrichaeota bacterium]|nr:MAG: hypothetical protein D6743_13025 [Calditrichota bacterium]
MGRLRFLTTPLIIGGLLLSLQSCKKTQEGGIEKGQGRIAGTVNWVGESQPCWPPDTCLFVALYDSTGAPLERISPVPCWPPDTCRFEFAGVPWGSYFVAVERVDSLFRATGGSEGKHEVLSFYLAHPDAATDPADIHFARPVTLRAKRAEVQDISIQAREKAEVAEKQ